MSKLKLPDTSLCTIVRDCETNPAGGIVKFIEHSMPFLEAGVVVDTGSNDRTKELLKDMSRRFTNLRVFYIEFNGFADSRNFALSQVETRRALVLDADERLSENDYARLRQLLESDKKDYYCFPFLDIYPNRYRAGSGIQTRLFAILERISYYGDIYECLEFDGRTDGYKPKIVQVYIKHFVPFKKAQRKKREELYSGFDIFTKHWRPPALLELPSFQEWNKHYPSSERIYEKVKNLTPPRFK